MDTVKSQMEVLSADSQNEVNYVSWRFKLNLTLKSKDLYEVATGIKMKPEGDEKAVDVITWSKKYLDAQTFIGLNVSSNIAKKIAKCSSAYQMLKKLETLYGKKSEVSVEGLQQAFFSYKYDPSLSVVENCQNLHQIADDISSASGQEVQENWIMTRILGMLPPKLHHFRPAWDNVSGVDKCLTTMFERLRVEEDRLVKGVEENNSLSQTAFISKKGGKRPSTNANKSNDAECFKCGKKGHYKRNCTNKPCSKYLEYCKNKYGCKICKEKGHFAKECTKNVQQRNDDCNDKSRRALITIGLSAANLKDVEANQFQDNNWYKDCAATQHMTSNSNWLINYTKLDDPRLVIIGNGETLKGIGIGDVNLEAFNGQNWESIVLKDVLHVPNMPFNLFSVTQLLDKGYLQSADAKH